MACIDHWFFRGVVQTADNRAMLALARKLGFTARRDPEDPYLIRLSLQLAH